MTFVPTSLDSVLVVLLAGAIGLDHWLYGRLRQAAAGATPTAARLRYYGFIMAYLWALTAGVVAIWIRYHRPWSALLVSAPLNWRFATLVVVTVAPLPLMSRRSRLLLQRPELLTKLRPRLAPLEALLPHTPRERAAWTYLAATAGICEEVLFRGFLLRFTAYFVGLAVAVPVTALLFGLAHAYQGRTGILKTGLVGLVLTFVALASPSLLPAMIAHVGIDLASGDFAYRLWSSTPPVTSRASGAIMSQ